MATSIYALLKHFSSKQNSAQILFSEFLDYVKRYSQHHVNDEPDLVVYLSNPIETLKNELSLLESQRKIFIMHPDSDKETIIVFSFFVEKITARFNEIQSNVAIPFPQETDLPKHIPTDVFQKKMAQEVFDEMMASNEKIEPTLYGLVFPHDVPIMLFPSTISINTLLDISIAKIRQMLRKEEYHDYFLKKIRIANPGKEIQAKNFFTMVTQKPQETLDALKGGTDSFYFFSQLCYFIRQDYEKVKDFTLEDTCLLQSVCVTELIVAHYKTKALKDEKRDNALKILAQTLSKPPYFFSNDAILKFTDNKGALLLGQYSEQDLKDFLREQTTSLEQNNLPLMLVFKTESGKNYFINKNRVITLVSRLCTDMHDVAKNTLTKEWYTLCKRFESVPEMKDQSAFNSVLEKIVRTNSPVLYALLNSNFLALLNYESAQTNSNNVPTSIFSNGKLLPYSELLMLSRAEILSDAKNLLPMWYTIPIISWIARLFIKKPKSTKKKEKKSYEAPQEKAAVEKPEISNSKDKDASRKEKIKEAVATIEEQLIPEGSTLQKELEAYIHEWNPLLGKENRDNLTEDINSLIRDYVRKILRTSNGNSFSSERIKQLAQTLCKTQSMQKIKKQDALNAYVQLYIVKILKNL